MSREELLEDERLDRVNEDIVLIQKKNGLTFGTDAFLLAAYLPSSPQKYAVELGAGTGIISLLCAARKRFRHIDAFEVQPDFVSLATRNAEYNGMAETVSVHGADIRDVSAGTLGREADVVFSNPPYMRTDSGRRNDSDYKYIARHEVCGNIGDFCAAAYRLLRYGGSFYCVFRPDRLGELMAAMQANGLALKQMTFVHADSRSEPSMVLVGAVKGGSIVGVRVTEPLLLYREGDRKTLSDRAQHIYDTMSFSQEKSEKTKKGEGKWNTSNGF